jgi:hypothetical protein
MTIEKRLSPDLRFLAPIMVPDLRRMGRDNDGGYVISDRAVQQAQGMLSFGVNDDWSFDQQWRDLKPQDRIHAYDGTISPSRMTPDVRHSYREFFGGLAEHFPVNIASTPGLGQSSFDDAMLRMNRDSVFIKMDIEGGEWQLTECVLTHAAAVTGMVIEFHNTARLRPLFCDTIRRYQEQFHIIHIHPNTSCDYADDGFPTVVEFSFLRRDLVPDPHTRLRCHIPGLDQANVAGTDDVALFWTEQ